MQDTLHLGWDVGAWQCKANPNSRDALVAIRGARQQYTRCGSVFWGNLSDAIVQNATPASLLQAVLAKVGCEDERPSKICLAIDTPLGWPDAFRALLFGGELPTQIGARKAQNVLLLRATERWLWGRLDTMNGKPIWPLSAVQDQIGSQSTKGILLLRKLGLKADEVGVWTGNIEGIAVTALEAYPAPAKKSAFLAGVLLDGQRIRLDDTAAEGAVIDYNDDVRDALVCACTAAWFAEHGVEARSQRLAEATTAEGWIWVPDTREGPTR